MAENLDDQYAVFGHPVGHSKSPQIHLAFAAETDQPLTYRAIEAPIDNFAQAVTEFRSAGGVGCNVTVPFKADAYEMADQLDQQAQLAGAVNTLYWDSSEKLIGCNTDGKGLLQDLQHNLGIELAGKRILLVGAGGAAAGIIHPLLQALPEQLVVINRTASRADDLVQRFSQVADGRFSSAPMEKPGQGFDLVLNATSASLSGELPDLPGQLFGPDSWAYDLAYADQPTPFLRWAELQGVNHRVDGLGMLVEQAAEAFLLWRGVRPKTAAVIKQLR